MKAEVSKIHEGTVVVDCLTGTFLKDFNEDYVNNLKLGGVSAIHVTVPDVESYDLSQVVNELGKWLERLRTLEHCGVRLATSVKDIMDGKSERGVSIVLGSQGAGFLGLELSRLDLFARLGMRMWQPTYQQRNQIGGGCGEKTDVGLSSFGVRWVERVNELGILISLSHVGYQTSMEIMEISKDPVVFDHSDVKAICNHARNITDEQIHACAEKGGVVGLTPVVSFLSPDKSIKEMGIGDYIDHIEYLVDLVGADHAGIGLDLCEGHYWTREQVLEERRILKQWLFPVAKQREEAEEEFLRSGRDRLYYYEASMPWLKSVAQMPLITEALFQRGYSEHEVRKIMGENFMRVFKTVWKD